MTMSLLFPWELKLSSFLANSVELVSDWSEKLVEVLMFFAQIYCLFPCIELSKFCDGLFTI